MSGGVDSSVAALILKNKGYDVSGVTMKLFEHESVQKEINDAKNVAKILNIDHRVLDLSKRFKEKVIDYFVSEYINGRTPNPCVMCNKHIKFGEMLKYVENNGFDYLSTGHYAKLEYDRLIKGFLIKRSNNQKDQSYVLFNLTQSDLSKVLFPIAGLEKSEIREIAEKNNLPIAQKAESQEICFIKDNNYISFIKSYTGKTFDKGYFKDKQGNILGEHSGLINYTVGQRKGLGISFGQPMYVTQIDPLNNEVILGEEGTQYSEELVADNINFIMFDRLQEPIEVLTKVRYKAPLAKARLEPYREGSVRLKFYEKQRAITPGQAVVFYDGDVLLGGGFIRS